MALARRRERLAHPLLGRRPETDAQHNDLMHVLLETMTPEDAITPRQFGGIGDGVADDTDALQGSIDAAISEKTCWFLPPGTWRYTTALSNIGGLLMTGCGMENSQSVLYPDGCHGFHITGETSAIAGRVQMRDLTIDGQSSGSSKHGFYYDSTNTFPMYQASFYNVQIKNMTGKGFFSEDDFSCQLINCHVDDCDDHAFDLEGANSLLLIGCYAHTVAAGKVGYRIRNSAVLQGCNGLDGFGSGTMWGEFGETTADDGQNTQTNCVLIGGNVEDWDDVGIKVKFGGTLTLLGTKFNAKSTSTFTYYVQSDINQGSTDLFVGPGTVFQSKGATSSAVADIYAHNPQFFGTAAVNRSTTADGSLVWTSPGINVEKSTSYLINALDVGPLRFERIEGKVRFNSRVIDNTDSPFTVGANDHIIRCDCSTGAISITLPSANVEGRNLVIMDDDGSASSNNITVNRAGSDVIEGSTSVTISTAWGSRTLQDSGAGRWIVTAST